MLFNLITSIKLYFGLNKYFKKLIYSRIRFTRFCILKRLIRFTRFSQERIYRVNRGTGVCIHWRLREYVSAYTGHPRPHEISTTYYEKSHIRKNRRLRTPNPNVRSQLCPISGYKIDSTFSPSQPFRISISK